MIPAIMAKSAASFDPYLYAVTHPRFRAELDKMFCKSIASGNFQASYYSRGGRTGQDRESDCETIQIGVDDRKKGTLERAETSFCDDSTISEIADTRQ